MLQPITLNAGGGTIDTNGFSLGLGATASGVGELTKTGAGTLRFAAPMTYTGGTTVNAGTLEMISGSSLAPTGALTVNGGTFDMSQLAANQTVGALGGTGGTIALGNLVPLPTNSASSTTFAGVIADGGIGGGTGAALVKQGSGTLTLTGNNTYGGGTTVSGGLINFSAPDNFGKRRDHLKWWRPAMGDRQQPRHLLQAGAAGRRRRHLRH